jgi:hypothetical protein
VAKTKATGEKLKQTFLAMKEKQQIVSDVRGLVCIVAL